MNPENPKLVLASSSPRRLNLLKSINIEPFLIKAPNIDETVGKNENPVSLVQRLAKQKAFKVREKLEIKAFILAADTVAVCRKKILPKAMTREQLQYCLKLISGRRHTVYTGIAIIDLKNCLYTTCVQTIVKFKRLAGNEILAYMNNGDWKGKAGGYDIQGFASGFIKAINGSYTNVIGLPLYETRNILFSKGFKI